MDPDFPALDDPEAKSGDNAQDDPEKLAQNRQKLGVNASAAAAAKCS